MGDLERALDGLADPRARQLRTLASHLVRKSVWIVGGDGWAYDIGYGGLDHVLASGRNINLLVLDTEVYRTPVDRRRRRRLARASPNSRPAANGAARRTSA